MENKDVALILTVHVDDILVSGNETVCEKLPGVRNDQFSTQSLGELEWYLGCAVEFDWQKGTIKISQPAMVDILLVHFDVKYFFNILTSPAAELGPTTNDDVVIDRPFGQAVCGVMGLAGITRPDIVDAARAVAHRSHNPREGHWVAVEKTLAYPNATRDLGIMYESMGSRLSLTNFADADYARKATVRRSLSGVAMVLRGATVCAINRT